ALYQALHSSLELRQVGLLWWIKDLSVRDSYFLLPALMGAAMILQQRLTGVNPGDDKTWIWMPLGFALLFAFFPAGLVLFWLADTLLSVGQLSWIARPEASV
ncbi:MAG: YidC/Oxa1 family membrane protein insertase, partial [bacterium]|nr:YidC/Oxa1 family membrane protein insertase [bacterium]